MRLPGHLADQGHSKYMCKSWGILGDKYENTIFLFSKTFFFSSNAIFPTERLRETVENVNNQNILYFAKTRLQDDVAKSEGKTFPEKCLQQLESAVRIIQSAKSKMSKYFYDGFGK